MKLRLMFCSIVSHLPSVISKLKEAVSCPFYELNIGSCMQSRVAEFSRRGNEPKRWSPIGQKTALTDTVTLESQYRFSVCFVCWATVVLLSRYQLWSLWDTGPHIMCQAVPLFSDEVTFCFLLLILPILLIKPIRWMNELCSSLPSMQNLFPLQPFLSPVLMLS